MFESSLVPRTAPVVAEDVPWEQFRELDPVGAAQAQAQCWAIDRGLCAPPDAEGYRAPVATAAVAAAVAELDGPALAGFLFGLPPAPGVDGGTVIEAMVGYERVIRWAQAMQLRWVAELAARREDGRTGWARDATTATATADAATAAAATAGATAAGGEGLRTPAEDLLGRVGEHAAAEVAFALGTTRRAGTDLLYAAITLTRRLPATLAAVQAGAVSARAAVVAAEETCVLDAAAVTAVDGVLAETIAGRSVPQARERVRRAVLSVDPAAGAAREARARTARSFEVHRRVIDGMGTFGGYAPIEDLVAIDERVTALARAARARGDQRSAAARRMDVVADLLLGRAVTAADGTILAEPGPQRTWRVDVVVSAPTLAGRDDQPGQLTGYGPITAPTARRLAGLPPDGLPPNVAPHDAAPDDGAPAKGARAAGATARGPDGPDPGGPDAGGPDPGGPDPGGADLGARDPGGPGGECGGKPGGASGEEPVRVMRAVWRRLLTDPESGIVRDYGTTRYRPPAALADLIRARDRYCYAPGCRQPAARCDLDHLKNSPTGPSPRPDPDGVTSDHNCGPACRYHHRVKASPGWQVTSPEPGAYLWTTPTGHTYRRDAEPPLDPPIYNHDQPPTLQPQDLDPGDIDPGEIDPGDAADGATLQPLEPPEPPMLETTAPEDPAVHEPPPDDCGFEPPPDSFGLETMGPEADAFGLAS